MFWRRIFTVIAFPFLIVFVLGLWICAFLARLFSSIASWIGMVIIFIVYTSRSVTLLKMITGSVEKSIEDIEVKEE